MLPLYSSFYLCFPVVVAEDVERSLSISFTFACYGDIGVSSGIVVVVLRLGVVVYNVKCVGDRIYGDISGSSVLCPLLVEEAGADS